MPFLIISVVHCLGQFEDVGKHGTKIVIYNLWCNDDGKLELDFESDLEVQMIFTFWVVVIVSKILPHILSSNGKCLQDIRICEDANKNEKGSSKLSASEQHLANRLRFSLRVSINVCDIYLQKFYFYFYFFKKITLLCVWHQIWLLCLLH